MSSFSYTIYIKTTPKKLWRALTEPALTKKWWGLKYDTDWQVGSTYSMKQAGVTISDADQVVTESVPARRLAHTLHCFTDEWATAHGFTDEFLEKVRAEPRSKVTFDLEQQGSVVKLAVVHSGFDSRSTVLKSIRGCWPPLLSSLKSLLEPGEPLSI